MSKWMPSKGQAALWTGAVLCALLSIPAPCPFNGGPQRAAVPTLAVPTGAMSEPDAVSPTAVPAADNTPGNRSPAHPQRPSTPPSKRPPTGGAHPNHPTPPTPNRPNAAPAEPGSTHRPSVPAQPPSAVPGTPVQPPVGAAPGATPAPSPGVAATPGVIWPTEKLRIRVIDGRTLQPLPGAEVVLIETEQRAVTDRNGYTPWIDAPIIRNPRYRPMVQELHGQLGVIAYKNGYRDSVHLGIRMHEGARSEATVWMYKIGPGDTRIEPVLYQVPYHHLWLIQLADKFRSKTQPGEGPERP